MFINPYDSNKFLYPLIYHGPPIDDPCDDMTQHYSIYFLLRQVRHERAERRERLSHQSL